ncbi:MAG: tetratricopeptide repeat protein [Saprospiraceae bacterium]|nr:tetratricopeptide repeat protein [Saprospiraceae bacterium]
MRFYTFFLAFFTTVQPFFTFGKTTAFTNVPDSISTLITKAQDETFDNFPAAITHVNQIIDWAIQNNNAPFLFKCYRIKGYACEQNNNLEEAAKAYSQALALQSMVSDTEKADIFLDWAILNKKRGEYNIAKEYYQNALKVAEITNDFEMVGHAYNGLATVHGALSDFEKAIEYHLKALEAAERVGKKSVISASCRNIAIIYIKAQNYDLALKNVEHAYWIALQSKDSTSIAHSLETHGKVFNAMGNPSAAITKHQEALTIMEKVGDKRFTVELLIQIGESYVQLNQLDNAERYYKRSLNYEAFMDYYEHPNFYYKWGKLCLKTGRTELALTAFNKSLDLAQKGQFKDLIQKNNAALAELYKQIKDFPKAFSCLERASAYSDSLFNEVNTRHITEAQFKYNVAQGERQIQALQLKQSRFWFILAIAVFLLVTAWLIYFLRAKAINNKILLQKNSEIQLQNRRLQDSNEILHQFAYASAHDLKEPLRSIGSFTCIIAKRYTPLLPPEASEYMNFITGGVKRMENLLSGLLEYSTIISEEHTVTKAFNLERVLSDVVKNLHSKILEREATVEFTNCDVSLFVSRLHLLQLFQNLVGNALKFTSDTPKVSINCVYKKDVVVLSVKDNGIGIQQEHGDKVFKLFQRLSRAPQYEGTGIGLTICKNIVEKHNGKIWFESEEGQGTTFFIELPIALVKQNTQNIEGGVSVKKEAFSYS